LPRLGEALNAKDGEQLQLLVGLGTGRSGEHEQRLRLILGEEDLAVHFNRAEFGVNERLVVLESPCDLVVLL